MKWLKAIKDFIKPAPGSNIVGEFSKLKKAYNEGKKIKGLWDFLKYIAVALVLWLLISKGIVNSLDQVIELLKFLNP